MNIYDVRRYGKIIFLIIAVAVVAIFLHISSNLVKDLADQERERMTTWADATKRLGDITMIGDDTDDSTSKAYSDFLLDIIQSNHTIPLIVADRNGNILDYRNYDLPEAYDSEVSLYDQLSETNKQYLRDKLLDLKTSQNIIVIKYDEDPEFWAYLYYEDSKLLKRLQWFPVLQLFVMLVFIAVVYYAVNSTRRAEQNKVWVGLSKETAHQLGTPISSLMAWMELLDSLGVDADTIREMNKDVNRLSTIASRFSKIGSKPTLELTSVNEVVDHAASYMSSRISSCITLTTHLSNTSLPVLMSEPLVEWVMENLIKNAVDAMEGSGRIDITTSREGNNAVIDVTDTGKGIPRKRQKTVFNPGYTTKKRGWGLGLTLARRIVEQYHSGRIYVLRSEPQRGTTFRITFPLSLQ